MNNSPFNLCFAGTCVPQERRENPSGRCVTTVTQSSPGKPINLD